VLYVLVTCVCIILRVEMCVCVNVNINDVCIINDNGSNRKILTCAP
jgi:hypothetical protein